MAGDLTVKGDAFKGAPVHADVKKTLTEALDQLEKGGEVTAATANKLFAAGAQTPAIRDYVTWATQHHGGLNDQDNISIAALLMPIRLAGNPKAEAKINAIREKGTLTPQDSKELVEAVGNLSTAEESMILKLLRTMAGTPNVREADITRMLDSRDTMVATREEFTVPHHNRIQAKKIGKIVLGLAAAFAVSWLMPPLGLPAVASKIITVASAIGAAWGVRKLADKVVPETPNLVAIAGYGVDD